MVTLQQWKEKLLEILDDVFYTKTEINAKENTINQLIDEKLDISDAVTITVVQNKNNIVNDGIYMLDEE